MTTSSTFDLSLEDKMNGSSNQCSMSTIERARILHNDTYEIANQPIHEITDYI